MDESGFYVFEYPRFTSIGWHPQHLSFMAECGLRVIEVHMHLITYFYFVVFIHICVLLFSPSPNNAAGGNGGCARHLQSTSPVRRASAATLGGLSDYDIYDISPRD